jgi:hypothetical protein
LNFSIFIVILYLALLSGMLFWAKKSTDLKRAAIKKYFNWEDHQIRSTGYDDPRIRKYVSTGWSLAFVMVAIFMAPIAGFGETIWVQILAVLAIESLFFIAGLIVIKRIGLINWYLECFICNFQFSQKAFILTTLAIFIANIALIVPFDPFGMGAQLIGVVIMAIALYFMVSPILKEKKYYLDRNSSIK